MASARVFSGNRRTGRSLLWIGCAALAGLVSAPVFGQGAKTAQDPLHSWAAGSDPASLQSWVNARLAAAKADVGKVIGVTGAHTVGNTLQPYDDAVDELGLADDQAGLMTMAADTAAVRNEARTLEATISSAETDLSLNQKVYRALTAVPLPARDAATKYYLQHTLLEYRLAGVDKDDATRRKIRQLQDRITQLRLAFQKNIADDVRKVTATKAELAGLPPDYIARHKPNADGTYTLTTDAPDSTPVLTFAANAGLRKRMYLAYNGRAYPQNMTVLKNLLIARQQLATTLGYKTYADLATADQMIGSAANVKTLLHRVNDAAQPVAHREYAELLAFARQRQPGLTGLSDVDREYWPEQYERSKYNFDAQSVRLYFPYAEVQAGILETAGRLFRVRFQQVTDAKTWDPAVAVFDVFDNASPNRGKHLGRIYLDMHPREGKYKWFATAELVPGIGGRQIPEGMLICNFPGGTPGDPGLMQYSDVVTFFHEFGHLMHMVLGGQGRWSGQGAFHVENDFVEAPSQMLEEMFHNWSVVSSFAKNYKTGETIPAKLFARMVAADAYGRGIWVERQVLYSTFSLQIHNRAPSQVNFDALLKQDMAKFSPFTYANGYDMYTTFGQLADYSSNYYTYVLDKVIALDFFDQFDRADLLNGPTALRYRRTVLEPGASKPATELVRKFLGHPRNIDALKKWMDVEFQTPAAPAKGE